MSKNALLILIFALIAINSACGMAETPNTNVNTNVTINNQTNLPSEFKREPVSPSGNTTPGIPDPKTINANNVPKKGATPTPGIPDSTKTTPFPKGATPTPGIPDEKTLKKQIKNAPMTNENPAMFNSNTNVKQRIRKP